ncbi:hypothetical protein HDV00_001317 [Rhizophlyctis rosea]|nr:hypothetical protein HDV00_001317 [Rhizophlyctis rosea]
MKAASLILFGMLPFVMNALGAPVDDADDASDDVTAAGYKDGGYPYEYGGKDVVGNAGVNANWNNQENLARNQEQIRKQQQQHQQEDCLIYYEDWIEFQNWQAQNANYKANYGNDNKKGYDNYPKKNPNANHQVMKQGAAKYQQNCVVTYNDLAIYQRNFNTLNVNKNDHGNVNKNAVFGKGGKKGGKNGVNVGGNVNANGQVGADLVVSAQNCVAFYNEAWKRAERDVFGTAKNPKKDGKYANYKKPQGKRVGGQADGQMCMTFYMDLRIFQDWQLNMGWGDDGKKP